MLKINYPKDLKKFKKDYLEVFDIDKLEKEWNEYKKNYNIQNADFSIQDMLIKDFKTLYNISFNIAYDISDRNFVELNKIFNYRKYQSSIANFFMKYKDELNLSTCYYCNIDYINVFMGIKKYFSPLDFLNNSDLLELEQVVGKNKANILFTKRHFDKLNDILELDNIGKATKNKIELYQDYLDKYNHFTLDHVIDKANNPIVDLSLFNFVLSCYSCNSKFKKTSQFVNSISETSKSPTCKSFDFYKKVKFKIFYKEKFLSININDEDDFKIEIKDIDYDNYINIFKLNERYEFHKCCVLNLIKKEKNIQKNILQRLQK